MSDLSGLVEARKKSTFSYDDQTKVRYEHGLNSSTGDPDAPSTLQRNATILSYDTSISYFYDLESNDTTDASGTLNLQSIQTMYITIGSYLSISQTNDKTTATSLSQLTYQSDYLSAMGSAKRTLERSGDEIYRYLADVLSSDQGTSFSSLALTGVTYPEVMIASSTSLSFTRETTITTGESTTTETSTFSIDDRKSLALSQKSTTRTSAGVTSSKKEFFTFAFNSCTPTYPTISSSTL
jgi:hypothetical protein